MTHDMTPDMVTCYDMLYWMGIGCGSSYRSLPFVMLLMNVLVQKSVMQHPVSMIEDCVVTHHAKGHDTKRVIDIWYKPRSMSFHIKISFWPIAIVGYIYKMGTIYVRAGGPIKKLTKILLYQLLLNRTH